MFDVNSKFDAKLQELSIPPAKASGPAAQYANCRIVGNFLYLSGKGPHPVEGECSHGKLGREFTTEQGYEFARLVGIEMLAVLKSELGSLERIEAVVSIQGFINATEDFTDHAKVLNGLSDLFIEIFGSEIGNHSRSVLGANSLRDNLPVIATGVFLLKENHG